MSYTPHSSFYGINKVVYPFHKGKNFHINDTIKEILDHKEKNPSGPKQLKIFDSFFSDTLDDKMAHRLFNFCLENEYEIQIVLFDPFSQLGVQRAGTLPKEKNKINSSLSRSAQGLYKIYSSIHDDVEEEMKIENYFRTNYEFSHIKYWTEINRRIAENKAIEIKYINTLSEVPVYIIDEFAIKGHFFLNESAAKMPWILSIDDTTKDNDLYDYLNNNFKILFDSAYSFLDSDKHVFISYDHNHGLLHCIKNICSESQLIPVYYYTEDHKTNHHEPHIEQLNTTCINSIFMFSQQENIRPNVVEELKARYKFLKNSSDLTKGKNLVLTPTNFDFKNHMGSNTPKSEYEDLFEFIECDEVERFPKTLIKILSK